MLTILNRKELIATFDMVRQADIRSRLSQKQFIWGNRIYSIACANSLDILGGNRKMKIGIIRCAQTEDYCPGTTDFKMIREKKGAFQGIDEDIEIIGFINCGGCPGKKAVLRARELVERGADTIVFASCIQRGTPIGYPCPFAKKMKELIVSDLPDTLKYIDYTH